MRFTAISCMSIAAALLAPALVHAATAYGTIQGMNGGSQAHAIFYIDGMPFNLMATITPSVGVFSSYNAMLEYDSVNQLVGAHNFHGVIGVVDLNLNLDNGPKITGTLDFPLSSKASVGGKGYWSVNWKSFRGCNRYYK